jgi:tetratricopeptide (TPR) repeat protein
VEAGGSLSGGGEGDAPRSAQLWPLSRDQQGWAYTQLGRYEEAIPLLKRDLTRSNFLWDHVHLVQDYIELGQEDAARAETAEVERQVALNPSSIVGYQALALSLNYMGEHAQALVVVEKAKSLNPRNLENCLQIEGWAYQGLGRYQDAIVF